MTTISQPNTGLISVDVIENALISNFTFGSQANQAAHIRIGRRIGSGTLRRHCYRTNQKSQQRLSVCIGACECLCMEILVN